MVSFLLIISFILHLIALFAIYQLLKQIQELKQKDSSDITELFETYLQEIKNENRLLQKESSTIATKEKSVTDPQESLVDTKLNQQEEDEQIYYTPPKSNVEDRVEASLQARILQLYKEGFSETEIAQQLNCGKTEAALIIKLYG
ncbi:hypothetical protein CIL05_09120 [Virgibacillus profundi]|uniref:Swarming motility protein SwrB n=1 Tax=Virgibacillus profundi TaxID=2024555 RepID=A0A2A2IEH7_9BACI|nr:hypothetical protein [Virgibacillus profundi]PAV30027.1 hypothetical protein CIL05_09120 [Virgibacillus profundi]PXY54200.1 hypothetical protein CIT14_09205 [Virgibacillus profundi]